MSAADAIRKREAAKRPKPPVKPKKVTLPERALPAEIFDAIAEAVAPSQ